MFFVDELDLGGLGFGRAEPEAKRVGTEMALHVLADNLKRAINIMGIGPLIAAMSAA